MYISVSTVNQSQNGYESVFKMPVIQSGVKSFLITTGLISGNVHDSYKCESDNFANITEYLASRRTCLLKYCGDVCKTRRELDERKNCRTLVLI